MSSARPDSNKPWTGPLTDLLAQLDSRPQGLSAEEAAARLQHYGANVIEQRSRRRLIVSFLLRFRNPLVLVLLSAAVVSAFVKDPASFAIIATMVLLSITLDFVQEHRAENAAESLRQRVALTASVVRGSVPREIPVIAIVPGDVITLAAGDLVPADCRLIESRDLFVNEAALTGESFPADKQARDSLTGSEAEAGSPVTAVFAGSSVLSGMARALVVATGRRTRLGGVAGSVVERRSPTAFTIGLRDFGLLIVRLTLLLVFLVLLANLLFQRSLLDSLLFALALAVGLTPELLPMVVSVTLAHGAVRMASNDVIVKRLSSIQDLGSMDVLCSDKTGTLTEGRIKLVRQIDITGAESRWVLELAYLNASFETGIKSPLDEAIMATGAIEIGGWKKIDEVPFDFERRRVSVLAEKGGARRLIVKGAPEDVVRLASRFLSAGHEEPRPLDEITVAGAARIIERLGAEGFRLLGVAWKDVEPDRDHADLRDECDLIFAGFVAFLDPPRPDARNSLAALQQLGVPVKILTGDNEQVTQHVCRELGLTVEGIVTGPQIEILADEALSARVESTNLFCRMTPAQKARVITALRRRGHIVGYLGDGINDASSLHEADVGLSVEGAVDVARAAADMILLRKDLGVLAEGVREGRRTFANIMKYVMMGTSSNFGNMFSMAAGVLFLPFLPMLPVQILFNNLLYDISETAIPMDRVDDDMVKQPRHWDMSFVRTFMLVFGPISSIFDFATFALLLGVFEANEALFQTGWFIESLATQILVIFVIRTRGNPINSRAHPLLTVSTLCALAVAIMTPYTGAGAWLGLTPPPPALLVMLIVITTAYLLVVERIKRSFYRHMDAKARRTRPLGALPPAC